MLTAGWRSCRLMSKLGSAQCCLHLVPPVGPRETLFCGAARSMDFPALLVGHYSPQAALTPAVA